MATKVCTKCEIEKPVTDFTGDSQKKDGLRSSCKDCAKKDYGKRGHQPRPPKDPTGKTKLCTKCNEWKLVECFSPRGGGREGYQAWCKPCLSAYSTAATRAQSLERLGLAADYDGDIRSLSRTKPEGSTCGDGNGYVLEKRTGHHRADKYGWVFQHILVAEEKFGFPITRDFTVHHKNDDRADNAPHNLELRVGNHGKHGDVIPTLLKQEDLRQQAIEVLATYGYVVTKVD